MTNDNRHLVDGDVLCPVCSSPATVSLWSDTIRLAGGDSYGYRFLRCNQCYLHFMYPLPGQQVIQAFYQGLENYGPYAFHDGSVGERYSRLKMWIAQHRFPEQADLLKKTSGQALAMVAELLVGRLVSYSLSVPLQYPFDASMLDVGCGAGDWLMYMKQAGYQNLMGQDIAGSGSERLKEHGIPVAVGDLCELGLSPASFDLIRIEHVLEHLPDPVACVCEVKRLLKPGGRLVINVPGIESLSFRLARQCWQPLQPVYHLHHFSYRSLKFLAEKTCLHLQRYRYLPVYEVMIASMSFRTGPVVHHYLKLRPVWTVLEPLYGVVMRLWGTGDFLTAEFINPVDGVRDSLQAY